MSKHFLVLDANILIRAVLGNKVRQMLLRFNESVEFLTPDVCIDDALKYLPIIFEKRGLPSDSAIELLSNLRCLLRIVDAQVYQALTMDAKKRIGDRDLYDWPIVATALTFNSPVWTEDRDFFGSGLAVWTTDRIHLFFESSLAIDPANQVALLDVAQPEKPSSFQGL